MFRFGSVSLFALVLGFGVPAPVRAELAPWDQAKVTELARQLEAAAKELYTAFYKQPTPSRGAGNRMDYLRLKQEVRRARSEARELARSLGRGEGREETLPIYQSLMEKVRNVRQLAMRTFVTQDVQQRAAAARQLLNAIAPYYDPDATPPGPAAG